MQSFFLPFHSSRIHYLLGGTGDKLLCGFHGYGESAESWAFLEGALGEDYTILAIDLPFHGRTDWKEELYFDPETLISLIGQITAGLPGGEAKGWRPDGGQSGSSHPGDKTGWWLMGYSMGGRIALSLLEKMPQKVQKLVLLAPDGLKVNGWYWLATQTGLGNRFFRWTIRQPGWLFFLLRLGNALKLVNRSVYKFTAHYIGDAFAREQLYARWTTMRGFRPNIRKIQALIREKEIPIRLLYGQHDRIIRPERGEKFRKGGIEAYCRLMLVPMGHQLLQARNGETILSLLKD
ncbi:MAG TPA: alpha/beta hydrolase [Puia sp.]|nr:alpha/beta hydrolase [Puia sp.]